MIFEAEKMIWSRYFPGEIWLEIVWDIDADGSYKKTVVMDVTPEKRFPDKVTTGKMTERRFMKLKGLLNNFPAAETHCDGCDGEGWEMSLLDVQGEIIHQAKAGYIDEVPILEEIAKLLP